MKKSIQKLMVSLVAVVTLGIITPSHSIWESLFEANTNNKSHVEKVPITAFAEEHATYDVQLKEETPDFRALAKEQSLLKFGTKVGPKIEEDFDEVIFPKMEQAIDDTFARLGDDQLRNVAITENPSGDYAEKIFNIYNRETKEDLLRFHVRTENRPFDGYYYNFHYHTYEDAFASHYDLGEIYWSRNTPPKWLS